MFIKHIAYLEKMFELFTQHNVTLNPQKVYIRYLSITLLGQKVNGLELTSAEKKVAAISK